MAYRVVVAYSKDETGEVIAAGSYLKIDTIALDHSARTATVQCGLYVSQAARDAGKSPAVTISADFEASSSDVGNQYAQIETLPAQTADTTPHELARRIYEVLPEHPALAALLAGAVAV